MAESSGDWLQWAVEKLFSWLSGAFTRQQAGIDGPSITTAVSIEATGYSREAEEAAIRQRILDYARAQVNEPYAFGAEVKPGEDGESWDCSELAEHAYLAGGLAYPDGSNYQRAHCRGRRVMEPKPADPFFFDPNASGIGHTGLYVGDGIVIEARGKPVRRVRLLSRHEIESHPRFAGWFRHPDFAYPMEERYPGAA